MTTALAEYWGRISLEALGLEKGTKRSEPGVAKIIKPATMAEIFRGWPEADDMMVAEIREKGLAMGCPKEKLAPGFQERLLEFTGTDETVDRMGDIIRVDGWSFDNFRANPVFMPWHDYRTEPIGQALDVYVDSVRAKGTHEDGSKKKPKRPRKRVRFVILFDEDELSERIFQKFKGGTMRATSVGFRPISVKRPDDEEREKLGMGSMGVIYEKQELLELSAVSVPANPSALLETGYELGDDERKAYLDLAEATLEVAPEFALQLRSAVGPKRTQSDRLEFDVAPDTSPKDAFERARKLLELSTEKLVVEELEKGVIPANVSTSRAPEETTWSAPTLADFTDGTWGALSSSEKRKIAGHFGWADASPASSFGGLKLPHHQASNGAIVFRGIVAAAGRFNQTALPPADKPAARRHLAAHFRAFGRDVPTVLQEGYEEGIEVTWELAVRNELDALRLLKAANDPDVSWLWDDDALEAAVAEDEKEAELEGEKGVIPKDPKDSDNAPMNSPAVSLSPAKLGIEGDFGEASPAERSRVARFFAWAEANPPGEFDELRFPHHRAKDGFRVFRSVSSNMRDLLGKTGEGENIPNADRRGVWRHLANHFRQFDRTPPPFKAVEDEVLRGAVQTSPDVWETDGKNGLGKWRYLEETGELSVRNFAKDDGTYDVVVATEAELEEIDELELDDTRDFLAEISVDFRGWVEGAVEVLQATAEGLLAIREAAGVSGSDDMFKTAEKGLSALLREMSAARQKIVDALPEGGEADADELEKLRVEVDSLSKNQITIQSLKFPKKVWKHESAVRVFADAAGFISDNLELKEGFFVLPQRKSALFDGMRDFCLSPGGSEPGDDCKIVATGGTLKSAGELAIGELASLVKEGFDRIEAAVKDPPEGVKRGAGPNGGAGRGDADQLYDGLLDVTQKLATKASPSKET